MARITKRERADALWRRIQALSGWRRSGIQGYIYGYMTEGFTNRELDKIEEKVRDYEAYKI